MPAALAIRVTSVDGLAGDWPQDQRPFGASPAAGLEDAQARHGQGHGGGLAAFADQVQHATSAQGLAVDAEQVRQRAVVHGDGLGDLEESDQLEPVKSLSA